jgi:allantoate deiminase
MTDAATRAARIMARCDALAVYSIEPGAITRPYGTPALTAAMDDVASWMRNAGMKTRRDAIGNLIGVYDAAPDVPSPQTFLIGGHLDSVRNAGRYDGILGVLSGVAAVERLHARRTRLPFNVMVVAFVDEEGLRFHTTYLGSRAFAGTFDDAMLEVTDSEGRSLADVIRANGRDPGDIPAGAQDPASLLGWVEAHIEQGPVLEAADLPVGVVQAIVGGTRAAITFRGVAGHAGTVPMGNRHDALCAAAEFVLAVERVAGTRAGMVGTVGQLEVEKASSNVIPGEVRLTLDLRHHVDITRAEAERELRDAAREIADRRGVALDWQEVQGYACTVCDLDLTAALARAVERAGIAPRRLPSGAGHDAVTLSAVMPVAMLFVRCRGGVSHNPAESITESDVAVTCQVLDNLLDDLAREHA